MKNKIKVFLGGTCNESKWREKLITIFNEEVDYFNPVVEDWTPECMEEENRQKEICDYCLYVITPKMTGVFSIAEVVDDSNKRPDKTIFCFLLEDEKEFFTKSQIKSLVAVEKIVEGNGSIAFMGLHGIANFLNRISNDLL